MNTHLKRFCSNLFCLCFCKNYLNFTRLFLIMLRVNHVERFSFTKRHYFATLHCTYPCTSEGRMKSRNNDVKCGRAIEDLRLFKLNFSCKLWVPINQWLIVVCQLSWESACLFLLVFKLYFNKLTSKWTDSQDSVVCIATMYRLDGSEIESRWRRDYPHPSSPGAHPTSLIMRIGSFTGLNQPGRGADHPLHLAPRLKKE
jgi:hypothetical protein